MPSVTSRAEAVAALQAAAADVRTLGVRRLGLFGSFAHGAPGPASDVDVLVEFAAGAKSFRRLSALADLLEDRLGRRVEIVTPESLSPYIGPSILDTVEYVV